ncbi:MAG: 5-(carboxyamino)imidazole ribonucleotide mutase [Verrucomicrobiales bacterium]|jgi:5-(carboxyamino)imidazole ribonucleotide mutase
MTEANASPLVGIIMGSQSDWPTLSKAAETLRDFKIPFETRVVSAHRTPQLLYEYAKSASDRGLKCLIAGAGGAAHLPGMAAAITTLPVLAVPVKSRTLNGVDSLLSIVQMPAGIPTATFAIGDAGATNAGLFAIAMLAISDPALAKHLTDYRESLREKIESSDRPSLDDLPA